MASAERAGQFPSIHQALQQDGATLIQHARWVTGLLGEVPERIDWDNLGIALNSVKAAADRAMHRLVLLEKEGDR